MDMVNISIARDGSQKFGVFFCCLLLAKQEWEEKLSTSQDQLDLFKRKYYKLKETATHGSSGASYMDDARSMSQRLSANSSDDQFSNAHGHGGTMNGSASLPHSLDTNHTRNSSSRQRTGVDSVASSVSGLAQHARTLVGSFACTGLNERMGGVLDEELSEGRQDYNVSGTRSTGKGIPPSATTTTAAAARSGDMAPNALHGIGPGALEQRYYEKISKNHHHHQHPINASNNPPATTDAAIPASRSFREYTAQQQPVTRAVDV